MNTHTSPDSSTHQPAALDGLYREAGEHRFSPGWIDRAEPYFWPRPRSRFAPARWRYADARRVLDRAGPLIDVQLAERRNMVLVGPAEGNDFATHNTFVCAYQMILPGEVAPTHRHSAHALRVILDAEGTYSVVDGERVPMESGDIVLTPGGSWHGHGHEGDRPGYWVDALDVPLVHLLEPMYFEPHPEGVEPVTRLAEHSPMRFPHADIQAYLDAAPDIDGRRRIELPTPSMPSMALSVERLAPGASSGGASARSTENRFFVVMDGSGTGVADGAEFSWTRGDTFTVPMWVDWSLRVAAGSTIFCVTDAPVMQALAYFRGAGNRPHQAPSGE